MQQVRNVAEVAGMICLLKKWQTNCLRLQKGRVEYGNAGLGYTRLESAREQILNSGPDENMITMGMKSKPVSFVQREVMDEAGQNMMHKTLHSTLISNR